MRSMWKGAISFGLVNIPVRMYAATENKAVTFNYLHAECHTPIRYAKMCPTCRREVTQAEIVRGHELERDRYVALTEEDFRSLPLPTSRAVEIMNFIDLEQIDPIYYEKSYYLEPGDGALKPYALLRQAMLQSGKVAIAKIAIRARESICCLRVYKNTLTLATMHYPDEVRPVERLVGVSENPAVSKMELQMAVQLIEGLAAPFEPEKYKDDYRSALQAVIAAKAAGQQWHEAPDGNIGRATVVDLMAALEASLQALDQADKANGSALSAKARAGKAKKRQPALAGAAPPGS